MRLNSKILSEHQSVTCLDIPSQLLTVTNVSISQRKRMIAPGGSCTLGEYLLYGGLIICGAMYFLVGVVMIVLFICNNGLEESQDLETVRNRYASEADRGAVSVRTIPITDAEGSSIQMTIPITDVEGSSIHKNEQDTVLQTSADSGETPSPKRYRRRRRHYHRRDKEDTVTQINTDTSQEGNVLTAFASDR